MERIANCEIQYRSSSITMSFMKIFRFNVRDETVALLWGFGLMSVGPLQYKRRRRLHMQDALARQRQQHEAREARSEINRIDHALCQKWAGKVDPEYWK